MSSDSFDKLGPREREIMAIVYRRGRATAEEVREDLKDMVSNAAVRGMLRLLEEKGLVAHDYDGPRFVYYPTTDPAQVSSSILGDLVRTFHNNSASSAVAAIIGMFEGRMTDAELNRIEEMINEARGRGGRS
jgi:predicted transcriptional regulator